MSVYIQHPDGTVEPAIRKLNDEEQEYFSGAVVRAYMIIPAFRDAIALMRPFLDRSCSTAYTDAHSRVGLSPWFFEELDLFQRASVLLHEAFHVLNNTFTRSAALGAEPDFGNVASDLEINSCLSKHHKVDLSFGIMPDRDPFNFEMFKTMEQYYHLIKQDPDLQKKIRPEEGDENCPVHGKDKDKGDQGDQGDEPGGPKPGPGPDGEQPGPDGSGGDEGEDGDGGEGDQPGDGNGDGEGDGEGQGEGSGEGQGQGQGQPKPGHGHGQGPKCTCPHSGGQGNGDPTAPGEGQGNTSTKGCDQATDARSDAADEAGVERASTSEQNIAKKNTAARFQEELQKSRAAGNGAMEEFWKLALNHMRPPKVNWRDVFRRVLSSVQDAIIRGRSDYSYRRISRRLTDSRFIFPGMVTYQPKVLIGVDTSGSMGHDDHMKAAMEIEGIAKAASRGKGTMKIFSVDTQVKNCKPVTSAKNMDLQGGGGTAMEVGWQFAKSLPPKERPDIFVLATDGYTSWPAIEEELRETNKLFKSVVLVTTQGGYEQAMQSNVPQLTMVIDISEDD